MKTTRSMKLYLTIAVLALALVPGGCAIAPKAERWVAPPLGTTYTLARTNTGSFGSGASQITMKVTERMWEGKQVKEFASSGGAFLLNADGSWITVLGPDDKPIFTWDPPIGPDYPLEVGETWTKSYRVTVHAAKQAIPFDSTWKVEAYEDVTVPAGTFKAFKISYSDTLGNESMMWYMPELGLVGKRIEKRTAKNRTGPGTRDSQVISYTIAK
ncbi:MAG: hypothetical protein R6V46_10080 [Desulfatiglandaceae bacterium]